MLVAYMTYRTTTDGRLSAVMGARGDGGCVHEDDNNNNDACDTTLCGQNGGGDSQSIVLWSGTAAGSRWNASDLASYGHLYGSLLPALPSLVRM